MVKYMVTLGAILLQRRPQPMTHYFTSITRLWTICLPFGKNCKKKEIVQIQSLRTFTNLLTGTATLIRLPDEKVGELRWTMNATSVTSTTSSCSEEVLPKRKVSTTA